MRLKYWEKERHRQSWVGRLGVWPQTWSVRGGTDTTPAPGIRMDQDPPVAKIQGNGDAGAEFPGSLGESGTSLVVTERRAYRGQLSLSAFSLIFNQNWVFFFTLPRCCTPCIPPPATEVTPRLVPLGTTTVLGQQPGFTSSTGIFTLAYGEG